MDILRNSQFTADWAEGHPIGNGRLGAMVIGKGNSCRLSLNHDLLWREFVKFRKSNTKKDFEELKRLCMEGRYSEAEWFLFRTQPMTARAVYINPFVPAGDLYITTPNYPDSYMRALVLDEGCALESFTSCGAYFDRRSIASAADGVILTRLGSNFGSWLDGDISLSRIDDCECDIEAYGDTNTLEMVGTFEEGHKFCVTAKVYARGGKLMATRREYAEPPKTSKRVYTTEYVFAQEDMYQPQYGVAISYAKADEIIIATFISTDSEAEVHGLDAWELNQQKIAEFEAKYPETEDMWEDMYAAHLKEYKKIYGEEKLTLDGENEDEYVENLIAKCEQTGEVDPKLAQRLFSMSRYLCVTSGMPQKEGEYKKAPINLQGLWNRDLYPAWDCDYHTDLNLAMCYWPMDELGLSNCVEPLMDWLERIMPQAKILADDLYGCRGLTLSGCCDYKTIGRTDNVGYFWLGAASWLADILWQHYEYTCDKEFLRNRLMPYMQEISDFFADILVERDGYLMPPFGSSPEFAIWRETGNTFVHSAANIDIELIFAVFSHLEECRKLFGDDERSERNSAILKKLPLPKIKDDGMLAEFYDTDYVENEPGHRHRSPLVGLCPGSRISYRETPDYADASLKLINHRREHGKATSQAFAYTWDMQLMARLGQADAAYECLSSYSKVHVMPNLLSTGNDWAQKYGGLAWFAGQRIYQVEACISIGAGIIETIFDSRQGVMDFLPALADAYQSGKLENAAAKGGFEATFSWKEGKVDSLSVYSPLGGVLKIALGDKLDGIKMPENAEIVNGIAYINTNAGDTVAFECK